MKAYAVYRCLYGADFLVESIKSIAPYVERIFIFYDNRPWGNVTECKYKDWTIQFPYFDIIKEIDFEKLRFDVSKPIHCIYDHVENNDNQFTYLINKYEISKVYGKPDLYIIPEVDHVMRRDQIEGAINHILGNNIRNASTVPIELWRNPFYRIPERHRLCTMFWNMNDINELPQTGRQANSKELQHVPFYTHNFGFCFNPQTMLWKHLTAIAFSEKIKDDPPDPEWYERWLSWTPTKGNQNLEISLGYQSNISHAYPYDPKELPEVIKEKYGI